MAAKTPDSVDIVSLGNCKLKIATFETSDIDDGDTWASGMGSSPVLAWWSQRLEDAGTQGKEGMAVAYSAGTFTFNTAEDNGQYKLFVLVGASGY